MTPLEAEQAWVQANQFFGGIENAGLKEKLPVQWLIGSNSKVPQSVRDWWANGGEANMEASAQRWQDTMMSGPSLFQELMMPLSIIAAPLMLAGAGALFPGMGAASTTLGAGLDAFGSAVPAGFAVTGGGAGAVGGLGIAGAMPEFTSGLEGLTGLAGDFGATATELGADWWGGLSGLGGGEGVVGWDTFGNAAAGGTGEVGSWAGGFDPSMYNDFYNDFGNNFGPTGEGQYAPTTDPGLSGGGWTAADGSFGSNSISDMLQKIQEIQKKLPPGSSNILKMLLGGGGQGGGTGGKVSTQGGGGGGGGILDWITGGGTGNLANLINGFMTNNAYNDQGDFLKNTMERAAAASDPYGYGPYRKYGADKLQQTYQDPAAIWRSPEMQGLDKLFMDETMAAQAANGQLFNAPERLAQRENNFYKNLDNYRRPLIEMSGANKALTTPQSLAAFANPIVANELAKNMNQGALVQQGLYGLGELLGTGGNIFGSGAQGGPGSLITSLFGGGGGSGGGGGLTSLLNSVGSFFGGGGSNPATDHWTQQDTNIWDTLGNLGTDGWGY
jgi:hypothetical protein